MRVLFVRSLDLLIPHSADYLSRRQLVPVIEVSGATSRFLDDSYSCSLKTRLRGRTVLVNRPQNSLYK